MVQRNVDVDDATWTELKSEAIRLKKNVTSLGGEYIKKYLDKDAIIKAQRGKDFTRMRLVYAYVCGDPLHGGHELHLRNAKALGDKLIVGVLTDEAVMEKKPKPIIPFHERIRIVMALECVDAAVCQNTYSPLPNVKAIKPDILAESTSHKEQPANEFVEQTGGRVVPIPYYAEQSSSKIKDAIKNAKT